MDSRIPKLRAHQGWLGNPRRSARHFDVQCIINMCVAQLYSIVIKGVSTLFLSGTMAGEKGEERPAFEEVKGLDVAAI